MNFSWLTSEKQHFTWQFSTTTESHRAKANIVAKIMVAHGLDSQTKGLHKLESVTKGKLFVSY